MKKTALTWIVLALLSVAHADPIELPNPLDPQCDTPTPGILVDALRAHGRLGAGHSSIALERISPNEFTATFDGVTKSRIKMKKLGTGSGGPGYEHCPIEDISPID
jgi:hypothetical protein